MLNAEEIAYWNADSGDRWSAQRSVIDALFAPITDAALAFAAPGAGESVLDVGCGTGETTLRLARAAGPDGRVLGVDVSRPMLHAARTRIDDAGVDNATLVLADASTHAFEDAAFDLAFSRFGVMFFTNPEDAFANVRRSLRPGGRLAFVCWRALKENPWFYVPRTATLEHVPAPPAPGPDDPGPMSFADPARIRRILAAAGFSQPRIEPFDARIELGPRENAVAFMMEIGVAPRLLEGSDDATRSAARASIDRAVRDYETASGVAFDAAVWLVGATP